jgi:arginase
MAREVGIVGVPMDLGAGRRGVDMGPYAIRYAGLEHDLRAMGLQVTDHQNIPVPGPESGEVGNPRAKFADLIENACQEVRLSVARIAGAGAFPLVLGGDHAIAMGTVAGLFDAWGDVGVLWIDAHGDINTPDTTPSGNVHGMPVAAMLGRAGLGARLGWGERRLNPSRVVLLGTRTLDPGERSLIRELGIRMFTMSEIDQRGVTAVTQEAIELLRGPGGIHVSFDMDAVDPLEAPGVGTPWPGGLTYREAHLAMELLASAGQVSSMEVVEVNPIHDHENRTAKLAEELILSALGRTIA